MNIWKIIALLVLYLVRASPCMLAINIEITVLNFTCYSFVLITLFYYCKLAGPERTQLKLDWHTRRKICLGIAKGLAYLHEESRLKIVHRDIKATNILLDKDLNAKISDFGLAKLDEEENTHISTRVAGTM